MVSERAHSDYVQSLLCDPLTPIVMAISGIKRSFISNTSCFSNLYLIECFKKCKSKSYLKAILKIVEKCLNVTRKKLDSLKMKMCKGVHLRRVKIKVLYINGI